MSDDQKDVDGTSAKELKASPGEAQARMGG
jgi:hypothetical protein